MKIISRIPLHGLAQLLATLNGSVPGPDAGSWRRVGTGCVPHYRRLIGDRSESLA